MLRISSPGWEEHSRANTISELLLEANRHLSAIMDVGLGSVSPMSPVSSILLLRRLESKQDRGESGTRSSETSGVAA